MDDVHAGFISVIDCFISLCVILHETQQSYFPHLTTKMQLSTFIVFFLCDELNVLFIEIHIQIFIITLLEDVGNRWVANWLSTSGSAIEWNGVRIAVKYVAFTFTQIYLVAACIHFFPLRYLSMKLQGSVSF